LGTMSLFRGLTLWWLQQDVQITSSQRAVFVDLRGVPVLACIGLGIACLVALVLRRTRYGRGGYAAGSNPATARRCGLEPGRVWLGVFIVQGMLAGMAGLLYLVRSGAMQPTAYEEKTLEAIGAAVLGGVAISGGRGSVLGVLLGCLFLATLQPACIFLGI